MKRTFTRSFANRRARAFLRQFCLTRFSFGDLRDILALSQYEDLRDL